MVQPHNIATRNDDDHIILWATSIVMFEDDDATPKDVAKKEILSNLNNNLPKK
jgi:hypothetical protein